MVLIAITACLQDFQDYVARSACGILYLNVQTNIRLRSERIFRMLPVSESHVYYLNWDTV